MRVMVIGSGGREHALCWRLKQSSSVTHLFAIPGNPGMIPLATCLPVDPLNTAEVIRTATTLGVQLAVIGPEDPLAAGLGDALRAAGVAVFGPGAAGARIEADKWFAKELMRQQAIPTAEARSFTDPRAAEEYVKLHPAPIVLKAAGLARGKGVTVCYRTEDAIDTIDRIMRKREFGQAGARLVIEEYLRGPEVSVLALVAGNEILVLDPCQDHKAIDDGDTGPMTGGMGAYCPTPMLTEQVLRTVERNVLIPAIDGLRREGIDYRGVLYAGLMLTPAGPQVLEFNCRFGDPETQALMMRAQGDLGASLLSVANGSLDGVDLTFDERPSICLIAASKGYPGAYARGMPITGIEEAERLDGVQVFQSGTRLKNDILETDGGRVLGVSAIGATLKEARDAAYAGMERIHFEGMQYRKDIAWQALKSR